MHIVKSPSVGSKAVNRNRGLAVLTRFSRKVSLRKIVILNFIGVMSVIVCFFGTDRIFCIERRNRYRINRRESLFLTSLVTIPYGVQPCNVFHRQFITRKADSSPLFLQVSFPIPLVT